MRTDPRDPKEEEETTDPTDPTGAREATEAAREDLPVRDAPIGQKIRARGVMNNVTSEESKVQKTAERPHDR